MAVYKRGKTYWIEFRVNGQRIRESAKTTSKRKAEEFERNLRVNIADELAGIKTRSTKPKSFNDGLLLWLKSGAPVSMLSHIKIVRDHIGGVPMPLVPAAAHDMRTKMLTDGLSPQTVNRRLAVVRRVLNLAYREWDWLDQPLGQKIKLLSEKGMSREVYLTKNEVQQLVEGMESDTAKQVTLLAAYTGLRKSEILRLQPSNWQPPSVVLTSKTKSGRPRSVPVVDELHEALASLPFKLTDWELRKDFEQAREKMGRPDIRFHDLRHTFASWLAADPKIPLTLLRDLLGHSSTAVTSKYSHLRDNNVELITEALKRK